MVCDEDSLRNLRDFYMLYSVITAAGLANAAEQESSLSSLVSHVSLNIFDVVQYC